MKHIPTCLMSESSLQGNREIQLWMMQRCSCGMSYGAVEWLREMTCRVYFPVSGSIFAKDFQREAQEHGNCPTFTENIFCC